MFWILTCSHVRGETLWRWVWVCTFHRHLLHIACRQPPACLVHPCVYCILSRDVRCVSFHLRHVSAQGVQDFGTVPTGFLHEGCFIRPSLCMALLRPSSTQLPSSVARRTGLKQPCSCSVFTLKLGNFQGVWSVVSRDECFLIVDEVFILTMVFNWNQNETSTVKMT